MAHPSRSVHSRRRRHQSPSSQDAKRVLERKILEQMLQRRKLDQDEESTVQIDPFQGTVVIVSDDDDQDISMDFTSILTMEGSFTTTTTGSTLPLLDFSSTSTFSNHWDQSEQDTQERRQRLGRMREERDMQLQMELMNSSLEAAVANRRNVFGLSTTLNHIFGNHFVDVPGSTGVGEALDGSFLGMHISSSTTKKKDTISNLTPDHHDGTAPNRSVTKLNANKSSDNSNRIGELPMDRRAKRTTKTRATLSTLMTGPSANNDYEITSRGGTTRHREVSPSDQRRQRRTRRDLSPAKRGEAATKLKEQRSYSRPGRHGPRAQRRGAAVAKRDDEDDKVCHWIRVQPIVAA